MQWREQLRGVFFRSAIVLLILVTSAPLGARKRATARNEIEKATEKGTGKGQEKPQGKRHEKREERREQAGDLPAVMFRDTDDLRTLNLFYGAGGEAHSPDPDDHFVFLREDSNGSNPKFDVEDGQGVQWRVKLDSERSLQPDRHNEPQPETAASRLLWAAGYFVDEDYYLTQITVSRLPALHRGERSVDAGGRVHGVRLKRRPKDVKKLGTWDWFDNPFLGSRQFNGLRVMMALLNNWDLDVTNNAIDQVDAERRFLVSDLGASFGRTGNYFTRSKGVLRDYAGSTFIDRTTPDSVDFVMHSRPFFLQVFDFPAYRRRTRVEQIAKHVPRADARWLGQRLAQLSEDQLRDCFRAASYAPDVVDGFMRVVRNRIAALAAL